METITGERLSRPARSYLAVVLALAAVAVLVYQWLVFPDPATRKVLQLAGTGLFVSAMVVLAVSRRRR